MTKSTSDRFIFVACRPQSQKWCKQEILDQFAELKFSYSRPGFLTFKLDATDWPAQFDLRSTFARTYGWSQNQISLSNNGKSNQPENQVAKKIADQIAKQVVSAASAAGNYGGIHVWCRWRKENSFTPAAEVEVVASAIREQLAETSLANTPINEAADPASQLLDVIQVDPDRWWLGHHTAGAIFQRWPGGRPQFAVRNDIVSRAYYKTREALMWSALPVAPGDICAEIGSAPGGSCQRLLELGARVLAIDPADLNPKVADHANLRHLKMRGRDVPHRELAGVKWLLADSNIAPDQTLDMLEPLIRSQHSKIRGLLATLKMMDSQRVRQISEYVARAKSWGFQYVKTRQLAYGGQEICLMALRRKSTRRFGN